MEEKTITPALQKENARANHGYNKLNLKITKSDDKSKYSGANLSENTDNNSLILAPETETSKRKPGRPKGSKNKPKPGRRKGSKNKPKKQNEIPDSKQKIEIAQGTDFNTLNTKWKEYQVFADEVIAESEPLLMIGEQIFISRENLATIIGKPKSYKTFLTSSFGGAFLSGKFMNISAPKQGGKLLIIDTEQGKARAQQVQQRINRICGHEAEALNDNLTMLSVRELDASNRLEIVKEAIAYNNPDLVLIDGIRDLLSNFNDIDESNYLVNEIMKLSSDFNCGIITVIHQNKGDTNARGHLGSELMNKSQSVIEMRNKDKVAIAKPLHCRDIEFEDFSFKIDENGIPQQCNVPIEKSEDKDKVLRNVITEAMNDTETISRKELANALMPIIGKSFKTAERRIDEAIGIGVLEEIASKMYQLTEEE